jgi:hypothetical protein
MSGKEKAMKTRRRIIAGHKNALCSIGPAGLDLSWE